MNSIITTVPLSPFQESVTPNTLISFNRLSIETLLVVSILLVLSITSSKYILKTRVEFYTTFAITVISGLLLAMMSIIVYVIATDVIRVNGLDISNILRDKHIDTLIDRIQSMVIILLVTAKGLKLMLDSQVTEFDIKLPWIIDLIMSFMWSAIVVYITHRILLAIIFIGYIPLIAIIEISICLIALFIINKIEYKIINKYKRNKQSTPQG